MQINNYTQIKPTKRRPLQPTVTLSIQFVVLRYVSKHLHYMKKDAKVNLLIPYV